MLFIPENIDVILYMVSGGETNVDEYEVWKLLLQTWRWFNMYCRKHKLSYDNTRLIRETVGGCTTWRQSRRSYQSCIEWTALHRDYLPAIEWSNGDYTYCRNGDQHTLEGIIGCRNGVECFQSITTWGAYSMSVSYHSNLSHRLHSSYDNRNWPSDNDLATINHCWLRSTKPRGLDDEHADVIDHRVGYDMIRSDARWVSTFTYDNSEFTAEMKDEVTSAISKYNEYAFADSECKCKSKCECEYESAHLLCSQTTLMDDVAKSTVDSEYRNRWNESRVVFDAIVQHDVVNRELYTLDEGFHSIALPYRSVYST